MTDKSKELSTKLKLINDRLHFSGMVEGNSPLSIDYIPPFGDNLGYTSLELFLLSLSSCIGSAMLLFLRRMQKSVNDFEISSHGLRNENHPTGFKSITMTVHLKSTDVSRADLDKVVSLAEDKYCPVWAMIKGNVMINFNFDLETVQE